MKSYQKLEKSMLMKLSNQIALGLGLMTALPAFAAGTAAGTTINNKATLTFSVGGVTQPVVNSSPTGNTVMGVGGGSNTAFVVDRKVDLQVITTDTAASITVPGATNVATTFRVTNLGNAVQDFALQVEAMATGNNMVVASNDAFASNSSNFVVSNCRWAVAASAAALPLASSPGSFNTTAFADEIAPDGVAFVRVICDMPSGPPPTGTPGGTNGDLATIALVATARESACAAATLFAGTPSANVSCATTGAVGASLSQTAGADTASAVDTVFGDAAGRSVSITDAARDASHSARDAYKILSAQPRVTKTQTLLCDPYNFASNPKAIPGAIIRYSIRVENVINVGQTAADISNALASTFTDALDVTNLALVTDAYSTVSSATCNAATGTATTAALINVTGGGTASPARTLTANPTGVTGFASPTLTVTYNNATTPILPAVSTGATAAIGEVRAGEWVQVDFYVKVK